MSFLSLLFSFNNFVPVTAENRVRVAVSSRVRVSVRVRIRIRVRLRNRLAKSHSIFHLNRETSSISRRQNRQDGSAILQLRNRQ